jgi:hypothetical protein
MEVLVNIVRFGFGKSGGGPPQSKTLARFTTTPEQREASWSAPALWRFARRQTVREIPA